MALLDNQSTQSEMPSGPTLTVTELLLERLNDVLMSPVTWIVGGILMMLLICKWAITSINARRIRDAEACRRLIIDDLPEIGSAMARLRHARERASAHLS